MWLVNTRVVVGMCMGADRAQVKVYSCVHSGKMSLRRGFVLSQQGLKLLEPNF